MEVGVFGLRGRYWTDYSGEWWEGFVRMACQRTNTEEYDFAHVPILVMDYFKAPTEWVMAQGTGGL